MSCPLKQARRRATNTGGTCAVTRVLFIPLVALLLLEALHHGAQAKYASGRHRAGRRLNTGSPPLQQLQVTSVIQCLGLCGRHSSCAAINFGAVSETTNCQLLGQRACDGLPLVADAAVDYYDVYDEPQNLTAETQTPFWRDPICVQVGYCALQCAAEAAGDFCLVDAHCSAKLKPPSAYQCEEGACRISRSFWKVREGLVLPRWQLWRLDWQVWTWKKLKPGTCSLDINIKLGIGAEARIGASAGDDHGDTRLMFRFTTAETDLYYHDETGAVTTLANDASTPDMVTSSGFRLLKLSWCEGYMTIGPAKNPTLLTGQATGIQTVDFIMAHSTNSPSWMYVNSGVADRWLFEDSGLVPDVVMDIAPGTYTFRNVTPTNDVTIKYDCKAETDCIVFLQGDSETPRGVAICVACWNNSKFALIYYGIESREDRELLSSGPLLSATEFNTFTVRYKSGLVTVHYNDAVTPIYAVNAPHLMGNINIIGIGGCCSRKYVRAARYDPAWRTDTWMTEGRGFSAGFIAV